MADLDPPSDRSFEDAAFLRQFMAEQRTILRFILHYLPSSPDARDVLQETLVTLWAKRGEFDPSREFVPWACGIARNKVREFWRKQPPWQAFAQDDLMALLDQRREELSAPLSARAETLRDCVAKLPPKQRATLDRYYAGEERVETIAQREGRSVEVIYKTLQRTRRALLECVERTLKTERVIA